MLKASYCRYDLLFKEPAITSRQTMTHKETYFIKIWHDDNPDVYGVGECGLFRGLSCDDVPEYETRLRLLCGQIERGEEYNLIDYPSMLFGVESALLDLKNGGVRRPFPSDWSLGRGEIQINGLVWMGSIDEMRRRIDQKLQQGFKCLKFKIGGQDFEAELSLLKAVRQHYSPNQLEIRLDANGAFSPDNAMDRLQRLSELQIHSIEQPIRQGQWDEMSKLCVSSPIPIALDEELIGVNRNEHRIRMLDAIKPQYIILKPTLCGGLSGARQWIDFAQARKIGWWVTSALESNVGLNTLAQWVSTLGVKMPQGLGTGNLYVNNIASPIEQIGEALRYNPTVHWTDLDEIF